MSPLLKKSFDSAKCKTLLQITAQKLKVLRNKHALAVKSSRADVARLLEKSHNNNAEMEVDRVYREEKIVVLYNLLEQFCQLVSSRSESMKSQRECPLDLREAVASLIYAGSRCDEIEELKKVSGYLTKKYGSEFSLAAKELRSGCSVNTQVIENLSSLPLSFNARIKLLKDIAVEKKIKWEYDASKQPADSFDGLPQSTGTSNLSGFEKQNPSSIDMQVDEISERASGASKSLDSPHIISPKARPQSTYEAASSGKNVPTSISDPYALAKAQGRLDYKLVSDYMGSEHETEEHLNSTYSLQSDDPSRSLTSYERKLRNAAARQEMKRQLQELETVTKVAYQSATEAAKAAKLAVSIVHKQASGKAIDFQLEGMKMPEGRQAEPISSPFLVESSFGEIRDKPKFSPSKEALGVGPTLKSAIPEDTGQIQSKYVVLEEKSGSQKRSPRVEPVAADHIMMSETEECRPIEKPIRSPADSSISADDEKELEVGWKSRNRAKHKGLVAEMNFEQDKSPQSLPQSDSSSSDEQERPYFSSENASSGQQHRNLSSIQRDKDGRKEFIKPEFDGDDDDSREEASSDEEKIPHNSSEKGQQQHTVLRNKAEIKQDRDGWKECVEPEFDDDKSEEEEIPFYMKGRAAKMRGDSDDELAGAPSRKLMAAGGPSLSCDDRGEQNPSIQVRRNLKHGSASAQLSELEQHESGVESSYKPSWLEGSPSPNTPFVDPTGLSSSNSPRSVKTRSYMGIIKRSLRPARQH